MIKIKQVLKQINSLRKILPMVNGPAVLNLIHITGQIKHDPIEITDKNLSILHGLSNMEHLRSTLDNILIPRIVGTEGHKKVRNFIIESMTNLNWQIERDIFHAKTPNMGKLKFQNIIATQNPNAKRFLMMACHYDSKYIPNTEFLGATDSAVPCAMLINLATTLNQYLQADVNKKNDISLMFVFFDGEEAFEQWSSTDSIYGARNLAKKWDTNGFINRIDMLILLDLIGMPDPQFYSFFRNTEKWYARMMNAEERLSEYGYLENYTNSGIIKGNRQQYFQDSSANSFIEDDHVPFQKLGVPILHLIPVPFPDVWHTPKDNYDIIDFNTVENINKILRVFVAEYLSMALEK